MHYVIFDLEWNQPAQWDAAITTPVFLEGEIVEIGAVKLNDQFQKVDEFRTFIKPVFYPKMHKEVSSLTGIRDKDLAEKGIPFSDAYAQFVDWCGENYAFMTWSMSDMPILIDNMIMHELDVSDLPECYDIQRIVSREIMRGATRYSLETALALMKEKGDTAHDALNDARNTARICDHLDLDQYLEEYTSKVFAERPSGKHYENRYSILADTDLQKFFCPWCGEPVQCDPWISTSGNTLLGYGVCSNGDEFLVQLSIVHHGRGSYSTKRIIFEMSDDLWDIYMDKKEALGV